VLQRQGLLRDDIATVLGVSAAAVESLLLGEGEL
jgi:predicted transcriptional regulator